MSRLIATIVFVGLAGVAVAANGPPRCEVLPLPHEQVSFRVDGVEKTRWHFGKDAPRPFLYPFNGPSGVSLTRMGHPGAPNHDHHRSVWFAHHIVEGESFWSDSGWLKGSAATIRQREWLAYEDGDAAVASFVLDWFSKAGDPLLEQTVVLSLRPAEGGHALEVQTKLRPSANRESTTFEKTNFGLLAVRVAKSISSHFGDGHLTDSEGRVDEGEIFGKSARWMDYSGPIAVGVEDDRRWVNEGITFFDHPTNPTHPTKWHVRADGWMGASVCMDDAIAVTAEKPLRLRYLLHAHSGLYDGERAERIFESFAKSPAVAVVKSTKPHLSWEVVRLSNR